MSHTSDHMETLFRELDDLLKTGQFTKAELNFMEKYLTAALEATRKVKERGEKAEKS